MKRVLFLSLFLGASLQATLVPMPGVEVLTQRISDVAGTHFVENTRLAEQLCSKKKEVSDIVKVVDSSLTAYMWVLGNPKLAPAVRKNRLPLIESILKDFPEALKELEDKGLMRSKL